MTLAQSHADAAEAVLCAETTRFAIPVPSRAVRAHLEAERARRAAAPQHAREHEDAPPQVLRALWVHLLEVARALGIAVASADYDPAVYAAVYQHLLHARHAEVVAQDAILPTSAMSAYQFAVPTHDLAPTHAEAGAWIRAVEADTTPADAERQVAEWWQVADGG
ncbi:MAG: hypothetical protein FJX57_04560 [Alphaproteobacteria bacterium]|nr:hypothetical protein [Alphaproteobacteria bacterium]